MITCHSCNYVCEEYKDLAKHVVANKVNHRKGYKWASAFLLKVDFLNHKKDMPTGRVAYTEEQKESRLEIIRQLSGEMRKAVAVCPICKTNHRNELPIEYFVSGRAWRTDRGLLVLCCERCKK
jgi:hypothetical protein